MCGGGSPPQDNSDKVAAIEAQTAKDARAEAAAADAKKQAAFDASMNSAFGSGMTNAEDFFTSRGLDPTDYKAQIGNKANQIRSSIPNLASDPGSYFSTLGESVFNQEQAGGQAKALRGVNDVAPSGFSTSRIADTADDDTIAAILADQENNSKGYIDNLRGRGVITDSGYAAALKNLQGQAPGARGKLSEIGTGLIETGRGDAENIANAGRTRASNLALGDKFDPFSEVGNKLNDFFSTFFSGLGDKVRGAAPTNLFDTSGLANIAGAAQGAGNNAFDPAAVAGLFPDETKKKDDDPFGNTTSPF